MSKTNRRTNIRQRLAVELNSMRKEGFNIPRGLKGVFDDLDEDLSRQDLREMIAMRYNYITPSGIEIDGLDALRIMNNTINKQRGNRYE